MGPSSLTTTGVAAENLGLEDALPPTLSPSGGSLVLHRGQKGEGFPCVVE